MEGQQRLADKPGSPGGGGTAQHRPLYGAQTWGAVAYLLLSFPVGLVGFVFTVVVLSVGLGLAVTVVGLPLMALGLLGCRALATMERARTGKLLGERIPDPEPLSPRRPGPAGRVLALLADGQGWRAALYFTVLLPWGVFTFAVTLAVLIVGWPVLPWVVHSLAAVNRMLATSLLSPSSLSERVRELEDDRGTVVDTAAADLRRIERDLHDGAQARLVALAMDLGLAKEKLTEDPEAAAAMVDAAHGEVKLALQELRDLARGIHPAILTDRGLDAALSSVATRCTIPGGVRVTVSLPTRPASAIEGIAYFTATELLTNISKHSHAHTATLDLWRTDDRLMLQVHDDGNGGAQEHPGSGLAGLADRIRAVDGVFLIHSPHGGPTTITVELPWHTRSAGRS
ncbi:sensor histidine kinase [Peterkaempfera bronchialis]|uniref:histidine kinase n=1 Tax=Peterkaempfera bronchialis TaxID=2126346 RepID=A0A345SWK3_9ACTN|nr:sensor histidine kinase [Peterkaempfera bronchialis]AXI78108.1 sensor histidine kinase [Peterkaempfera bronchialis]